MIEAPLPSNEDERLAALRRYQILDTDPEEAFDDLTRVAARICGTPIALVSLIDTHRQWFKSRHGLDAPETPRSVAFCSHAILQPDNVMVVEDAMQDPRFLDNPLVTGDPHVIFYAGAPLVTPEGLPLGTLCVIDHTPRKLDEETLDTLRSLARATVTQLELRKTCSDLHDLSQDLVRSNQDLEKRNAEIRRFYQTLSHELKTPITIIREYVAMVLDGLAGEVNDEQKGFLTIGVENCDRMATNVNDLLDITRIENGKLRMRIDPLSVGDLLESAVRSLQSFADRADISLVCRVEPDLPPVPADGDRIVQVVNNLVRNAIKFTPPDGRVVVEACRPAGEFVEISVRDNGRGIPKGALESIFERLFQCQDDDASSRQGLGLGLHVCREIVRLHGGEIVAESEEGSGATFRFRLPLATETPAEGPFEKETAS